MRLSEKQIDILKIITAANPDGVPVDLDQLIERVAHKPTKAAIQFSIRALIAHGLIEKAGSEKRRGRNRVMLKSTALGMHFAAGPQPVPEPQVLVSLEEDAADIDFETLIEIV